MVNVAPAGNVPLPLVPGRSHHLGGPPRIGEHGHQVLAEAGYTRDAIAALAASGTLKTP